MGCACLLYLMLEDNVCVCVCEWCRRAWQESRIGSVCVDVSCKGLQKVHLCKVGSCAVWKRWRRRGAMSRFKT